MGSEGGGEISPSLFPSSRGARFYQGGFFRLLLWGGDEEEIERAHCILEKKHDE